MVRRANIYIKWIFSYLFFLFFIYSTDSFYASTNIKTTFFVFSKYLIVFLGCVGFLKTLKSSYFWTNFLYIFTLVSVICMGGYSGGIIFKFLLLFAGYCFVCFYGWNEFKDKYVNIITFIAAYSFICFLFASLLVNCRLFPIVENVNNYFYRDLFLTHFSLMPDYQSVVCVWRNYGPFWEPGVFQIYLVLAIIFVLFGYEKINKLKILVLTATLFSTFSTAAFITFFVVLLAFFLKKGYVKEKTCIFLFVLFGLIILLSNKIFSNMIFDKLSARNDSSSSRLESLLVGLRISLRNPLGTGPYLFLEKMKDYGYVGSDGNTNGFIQHFGIMGWTFGVWYVYRLYNFVKCFNTKNIMVTYLILLAIVLELCNEPLFYSLPFSTILFYKPNMRKMYLNTKKFIKFKGTVI